MCPVAPLILSRLPRAPRLSRQLCCAALRRLICYACARFLSSSAARFGAQAQLVGPLEQLCCVVPCASAALRCGHVSGLVPGPSLAPTRVHRRHFRQPHGGEFSAGGAKRVRRQHSRPPRGGEFSADGGNAFVPKDRQRRSIDETVSAFEYLEFQEEAEHQELRKGKHGDKDTRKGRSKGRPRDIASRSRSGDRRGQRQGGPCGSRSCLPRKGKDKGRGKGKDAPLSETPCY